MFRALEIAASGMAGQQLAMDAVAHNLANTQTPGFKASVTRFEELVSVHDRGEAWAAQGVKVSGNDRVMDQGPIQATGRAWDLAVDGRGFFPLLDGEGAELYTRSGAFRVDAEGRVVHQSGLLLSGGIQVPEGASEVQVAPDGRVTATVAGSARPVEIGRVELAAFGNEAGLAAKGQGLFAMTEASGPAQRQGASAFSLGLGAIKQGALEASNVSMIDEMVRLITTQRAFETGAKVLSAADEMLGYANNLRR